MTVSWDTAPSGLVKLTGVCDVLTACITRSIDGGSVHLCDVGKFIPYYTVQLPRRQTFS
jgi:hypothetical protein